MLSLVFGIVVNVQAGRGDQLGYRMRQKETHSVSTDSNIDSKIYSNYPLDQLKSRKCNVFVIRVSTHRFPTQYVIHYNSCVVSLQTVSSYKIILDQARLVFDDSIHSTCTDVCKARIEIRYLR